MRILKALVFISCIVLLSGVILAALAAPYFCLIWLETQHSFVTSEMVALSFVTLVVVVLLALGLGKIYFAIFDFLNEKLELRWGY